MIEYFNEDCTTGMARKVIERTGIRVRRKE